MQLRKLDRVAEEVKRDDAEYWRKVDQYKAFIAATEKKPK
jgi:hypothetical protein